MDSNAASMLRGRGARFFSRSRGSREKTAAFTLIETLVVATIVILVSVGGFLGLAQYRNKQALGSGLNEIRAAVEGVKRQSITQEQGTRWGVRFTNATSGVSSYSIFRGSSYSTSGVDHVYSLRSPVRLGNPSASSTYDVVFAPLSGALSENKVLTVIGGSAGLVGDLILRTVGSITARMDNGLVGYWHFDEGTSTLARDASGNANTGTLTNGPTWQSGTSCKAGSCLSFDGVNDYVNLPNSDLYDFGVDVDFTISFWAKRNGAGDTTTPAFIGHGATSGTSIGYNIRLTATDDLIFQMGNGVARINTTYNNAFQNLGEWHHVAVSADRDGNALMYYDGAHVTTLNISTFNVAMTNSVNLIGSWTTGNNRFNGSIDEVRFWNRALSAPEILAHYNDLK